MLIRLAGGIMALALCAGFEVPAALCSTVIVPDDSSTVTAAIASGADTVLVREGTYLEGALVERQLVLRGIGTGSRPRLSGLSITNRQFPLRTGVSGLDISSTVIYTNAANKSPITLTFSDCSLDNGIQLGADDPDAHLSLVLSRCHMTYAAGGLDDISMEADTLDGGVSLNLWSNPVVIRNCWFRGGAGPAIALSHEPYAVTIAHNRIENYDVSVSAPRAGLTIDGNTVLGCGTGIDVDAEAYVTNNVIRGCGVGIRCQSGDRAQLVNNTILNASGDGISVQGADILTVAGNVVGFCAGNGVALWEVNPGQYYEADVRNNTIFANRGSGVVWGLQPIYPATVRANIGYGNGGWGLVAQPGALVGLGCNDWFGNAAGGTSGVAKDSTDLSVDPMFCDLSNADVRLNSSSPLLADSASCGQIGALGVGCGATPTLVQRFTASRITGGVRVVWQVASGATASAIWVERADGLNGQAWTQPSMELSIEGASVVELDRSALPDHIYRYRLVARDGGTLTVLDPGIVVEVQAPLAFALAAVGPSPGGGPVRIAFTLARDAAIQIEVFDLLGRKVATPAQGVWPAGMQVVTWDGMTRTGTPAPAGMYVVRYAHPGGQDQRRITRFR